MARTVRDARLESRAARSRLRCRHKPFWRAIEKGAHLGYYKGAQGGSWCARYYLGEGRYAETILGTADDTSDADEHTVLSYRQAQVCARSWFAEQARRVAGLDPIPQGPYTVATAIADYLAWYETHRKDARNVRYRVDTLILPELGELEVAKLTPRQIQAWLDALAKAPARARTSRGKAQRYKAAAEGPDYIRRRRVSANKALTILKAALNRAWREGKVASDDSWRRIRPFHNVDAPLIRYLTEAECVRLVNACEPDFRQLVRAALLTGCRYGELTALRVSDFNPDTGTVAVRMSKSGKPRHVVLTEEGQAFFAEAVAGRTGSERIFLRRDGHPWGKSHQARPLMQACRRAKILPAVSFHVLRHTHGSQLAMRGAPMGVIAAQLGHSDTRMTEKHYAHLAPSYVADTIRASFPRLGILGRGNVLRAAPRNR